MPGDAALPFRTLARNNAEANHRRSACTGLSQAVFTAPRTGSSRACARR
ncbi:hypothetical protein ACFQX4_04905 [Roseomonas sp. GCM10028921]